MQPATMTNRTLEIDGMTCDACIQKVTNAIKSVPGVEAQSVKVGSAKIGADQAGCNAACAAIGIAGFKAREATATSDPNASTRAAPKASSEHKTGYLTGAPAQIREARNAVKSGMCCGPKDAECSGENADPKLAGAAN